MYFYGGKHFIFALSIYIILPCFNTSNFYVFSVFKHLENEDFSQFLKLIEIAEMEEEIETEFSPSENEDEPLVATELITLFAPTNAAFDKLNDEQKERLLGPGMIKIFSYFVVQLHININATSFVSHFCLAIIIILL